MEELHHFVSPEKLKQLSTKYRETYAAALPFPHIAIDGIFPESILKKVIQEHPESILENNCIPGSICFNEAIQNKKSGIDSEERMGMYTRILFSFLKSSIFTTFLQDISGIGGIVPDPHFRGSGLHFTATGGSLDIHADFNQYDAYNLDRRVNMFIYLNDDWPEEYGGHLELWGKDMKSCYQRIGLKLGRFVVFSEPSSATRYVAATIKDGIIFWRTQPRMELPEDALPTIHSSAQDLRIRGLPTEEHPFELMGVWVHHGQTVH